MQRTLEVPHKVTPADDSGYFEDLTKAIFRAGFNWAVARAKCDGFRASFLGFEILQFAGYGPDDVTRLLEDRAIIRNRRKIAATIENARTVLDLADEHDSFRHYLRSLDTLDYFGRVRALTGLFAGLGRTSAFVFLHCVNEETPAWQDR